MHKGDHSEDLETKLVSGSEHVAVPHRMLIINADDWGGWDAATNAAYECFMAQRLTSVTAMVFMKDSVRAARIAVDAKWDVGLHLNFNQPFTARALSSSLTDAHERVCRFLRRNKFAQLIYNPGLREAFRTVFDAQVDEFRRLYGRAPSHFDGHQHMHLCSNVLLDNIIPKGSRVRRSFSFWPGEKSLINRFYRGCVNKWLRRKFVVSDHFFALSQCLETTKLERVLHLADSGVVELMAHPEKNDERALLKSDYFGAQLDNLQLGNYGELSVSHFS